MLMIIRKVQGIKSKIGFTLFETLIGVAILALFFVAIMQIIHQVLHNIGLSRVRSVALYLAQDRMERIKNLPYDSIGTIGGIPQGKIAETESITVNNQSFTIKTSIIYIDDPYDGIVPTDVINIDYKRVRIEISWTGAYPSTQPMDLVTNIAPKGIETVGTGGTLSINIIDAIGNPVSNATVTIDNTTVNPEIHMSSLSDANGSVVLPGAPPCAACYNITATKNNFSTDRTYGSEEIANPILPHATVIDKQLTQISLSIDALSSVTIRSYGTKVSGYPVIGGVLFTIRGSKIIGYDTKSDPVYKYSYNTLTSGGVVSIPNLEWDMYTLDLSNSYHNLAGSNPLVPFSLPPATQLSVSIVGAPKTNISLLIAVTDASGVPQATATAILKDQISQITISDTTTATSAADYGQIYFGGLSNETYDLSINAPGFQEATSSVQMSQNQKEVIILNPL